MEKKVYYQVLEAGSSCPEGMKLAAPSSSREQDLVSKKSADAAEDSVICQPENRTYLVTEMATAKEARSEDACGPGMQMAMPKTEGELKLIIAELSSGKAGDKASTDKVWLGGSSEGDGWTWDDDTDATLVPSSVTEQEKQTFLCLDVASGAIENCGGDED